ncbi:MAG TPA: fibronectin type III domain-containing protein, partial [Candidatus Acidoferrum sp.]|nr:fibronectin type III domain-containing protein [Candidatus Acidoferrum sp.]
MIRTYKTNLTFVVTGALALVLCSSTAVAAIRDRTAPTKPGNFRVTAKTPFSITVAWTPSSDNFGNFTYRLWSTAGGASGGTVTLPKTATSFTWNTGIYPRNYYTFGLYAVDAAGNNSAQATVQTTVPADIASPSTAPVVTVGNFGSTYAMLSWTAAQDDGPYLFYGVLVNGDLHTSAGTNRFVTINFLEPQTTYVVQVYAADYGNNVSPLSAPVNVTTTPPNPNDTTPPTTPGNLTDNGMSFPDGETWLFWEQSTDNIDPQS